MHGRHEASHASRELLLLRVIIAVGNNISEIIRSLRNSLLIRIFEYYVDVVWIVYNA